MTKTPDTLEPVVLIGKDISKEAEKIAEALNSLGLGPSPVSIFGLIFLGATIAQEMNIPRNIIINLIETIMQEESTGIGFLFMAKSLEEAEQLKAQLQFTHIPASAATTTH